MIHQTQTEAFVKQIDDIIFAGYRFKGRYDEIGTALRKVTRAAGRHIAGKAMSLYYDSDYRERDADIEGGFPVSRQILGDGINCRMIPGSQTAVIIHRGSYETIGSSYEKLLAFIKEQKLTPLIPTREIYLEGPGMFFRGNPDKYCTEIQILVQ
jgi:effector-binding domain-containing protein